MAALCPYTGSETTSGVGLAAEGVSPAPIRYGVDGGGGELAGLMRTFWAETEGMLRAGQAGCSSIVLSAPCWDARWTEWCELVSLPHISPISPLHLPYISPVSPRCELVFPLLESSVLSAGLGRTLGIVCFHPEYSTPDAAYLARHRFGHMHSTDRLRRWLDEADPQLSARTDDGLLHWAGSYQRRSPHAMINVLWAEQLEVAETKRKSRTLYSRNVAKVLQEGLVELERQSAAERAAR